MKKQIEKRMLELASKKFKCNPDELDMVVQLLAKWNANEIEKLYLESKRVAEESNNFLFDLILPDQYLSFPEHAVLQAQPINVAEKIDNEHIFYIEKQASFSSENANVKTSFSPTQEIDIIDANVKIIAFKNHIYKVDGLQQEEFSISSNKKELNPSSFWIGIDANADLNIKTLLLHFNSTLDENEFLKYLPFCQWSINQESLLVDAGINNLSNQLFKINPHINNINQVENHVNQFYFDNFITIHLPEWNKHDVTLHKKFFPNEFSKTFFEVEKHLTEKLLWIEIKFPESILEKELSSLTCQLNCFPVIQRSLEEIVIPNNSSLESHEITIPTSPHHFLGIHKISSKDRIYHPISLKDFNKKTDGSYLLKRISNQTNSIDDENLFGINCKLAINTLNPNEQISINYWTTNGNQTQEFEIGENLNLDYKKDFSINIQPSLINDSILFISTPKGSRPPLNKEERNSGIREMLLNKGRLITKADFSAACHAYIGRYISTVNVSPGSDVPNSPQLGLVRTTDIILTLSKEGQRNYDRVKILVKKLKLIIENKTGFFRPIRILISQN